MVVSLSYLMHDLMLKNWTLLWSVINLFQICNTVFLSDFLLTLHTSNKNTFECYTYVKCGQHLSHTTVDCFNAVKCDLITKMHVNTRCKWSNLWIILILHFPNYRKKPGWIFRILHLQAKAKQRPTQLPLLPAPPALGWWLHTGCPGNPTAKHVPHAHPCAQFHFHPQPLPFTPDTVQPHLWHDE